MHPGGYWCPLNEWYKIYEYMADIQKMWNFTSPYSFSSSAGRVIGSETLIWGEENDDVNVQVKLWPRSAALAEALWSNPQEGWYGADPRMQQWRLRLVERDIAAEALQPTWCAREGGYACTTKS